MKRAVKFIIGFIGIIFLSLIILLSLFLISAYWETASNNFSENKHIERISDIIENKYIKNTIIRDMKFIRFIMNPTK